MVIYFLSILFITTIGKNLHMRNKFKYYNLCELELVMKIKYYNIVL